MIQPKFRIAFFGHDSADAAIRRRIQALKHDGINVVGYMMHRRAPGHLDWDNVDLGETRDGAFLQRFRSIFSGAEMAAKDADRLSAADIFFARNLDMLALAFLVKRKLKLDTPVIYESLDVHRLLSRRDPIGRILRGLEGRLLSRCDALIVSSPGFLEHHFDRYYPNRFTAHLIENRLAASANYGRRARPGVRSAAQPLQVGWVGMLRCQRSLDLLSQVADKLGDRVHIHLHGLPARKEIVEFEPVIERRTNMTYHGEYKSPEGLADIYKGLDIVWAGDFMEAGQNSVWLLPNRIYEGGYYGVPSVAPGGTQTATWINAHNVGFTVNEPLNETLPHLIANLAGDRTEISKYKNNLLSLDDEIFVQPNGFLYNIIRDIVDGAT